MSKKTIEFWFEYGSTYTYLTVARIRKIAGDAGVAVAWKPFLLIPIMREQGMDQGPFLPYPAKMAYMWQDIERRAAGYGIPYRKPSVYPPNTLQTARVGLIAAAEGWCPEFTEEVFRRHWVDDQTIGKEENLVGSLQSLGIDPQEILTKAQSDQNKDALKVQTAKAKKKDIFGSPSFFVGDELFWGDDRLEDAIKWTSHGLS